MVIITGSLFGGRIYNLRVDVAVEQQLQFIPTTKYIKVVVDKLRDTEHSSTWYKQTLLHYSVNAEIERNV